MENAKKPKVALVRGDSLNEWEGKLWESLKSDFVVTGFCSKGNLYNDKNLNYPVIRLKTTTDSFLSHNVHKFLFGVYQKMHGLEARIKDFDIVHTAENFYYYTYQATRAKQLNKNLKVAVTVWDNSFGRFEYNYLFGKNSPAWWRKKIYAIIKEITDKADVFLPVSKFSANMLSSYNVPDKKIKILSPAVINVKMDEDIESITKELKIENKKIYMMVNRMVKEKGIYDVLYAWQIFMKKNNNSNRLLLAIGSGPEAANIQRIAHNIGISESVRFVSSLPNTKVRALFTKAKCLILASLPVPLWQEQFGYVLAESITAGCPVITTYSGAIPEVIGNAGSLFAPGNPLALAEKLFQLDDNIYYDQLKINCEETKEKYSMENFRSKLTNIYQELLND